MASSEDDAEVPIAGSRARSKRPAALLDDSDTDGSAEDCATVDKSEFKSRGADHLYDATTDKAIRKLHEILFKLRAGDAAKDDSVRGIRILARKVEKKTQARCFGVPTCVHVYSASCFETRM